MKIILEILKTAKESIIKDENFKNSWNDNNSFKYVISNGISSNKEISECLLSFNYKKLLLLKLLHNSKQQLLTNKLLHPRL